MCTFDIVNWLLFHPVFNQIQIQFRISLFYNEFTFHDQLLHGCYLDTQMPIKMPPEDMKSKFNIK